MTSSPSRHVIATLLAIVAVVATLTRAGCLHDRIEATTRSSASSGERRARRELLEMPKEEDWDEGEGEDTQQARIDDFYKPLRLRLWFDRDNIDFPCGSPRFRRLREQTQRAADRLMSFMSGQSVPPLTLPCGERRF